MSSNRRLSSIQSHLSPTNMTTKTRPAFADLPLRKGDPTLSAWGLYGEDDQLGTLNLLTEEVVKQSAKEEIQTGVRIGLDLPLDIFEKPFFGRQKFEHRVIGKAPRTVNDDTWTMNSQSSTQWDGLRHFGYLESKQFYMGITQDDVHASAHTTVLGIHNIAKAGIVGRGVLLDFARYAEKHNIEYDALTQYTMSLSDLKKVAEEQGVTFRQGDILLTRSGFTKRINTMGNDAVVSLSDKGRDGYKFIGIENTDEVLEWIWTVGFSAVGGDQPSFEGWPSKRALHLHEVLLSGWGCPIGEFFDLERLAEHCEKTGRWTFFFTSEPCNVVGGVASPPNSLAIF